MSTGEPAPVVAPRDRPRRRSRDRVSLTVLQGSYDAVLFLLLAISPVFGMLLYGATSIWAFAPLMVVSYAGLALFGLRPLVIPGAARRPPGMLLLLLLWGYALVHVFVTPAPYEAKVEWLRLGTYIGAYAAWTEWGALNRRWKFLCAVLLTAVSMVSLYALIQHVNGSSMVLFHERPVTYGMRASGTYICPNHFAFLLEICLIAALAVLFMRSAGGWLRVLAGYALVVGLAALYFSLSRSGMLAAAAGLGLTSLLILRRKSPRLFWVGLVGLPLLMMALFGALWAGSAAFRVRVEGALLSNPDAAVATRLIVWEDTLDMIADQPVIGHGGGSYRWVFLNYKKNEIQPWLRYAHNEYLHITADYGFMGTILLLGALGVLVAVLLRRYLQADRDRDTHLIAAALGILVATLVHSIFDFNLHIYSCVHMLILFMAIVAARAGKESPAAGSDLENGMAARWLVRLRLILIPPLALILAVLSLLVFLSERAHVKGEYLMARLQPGVEDAFRRSFGFDPLYWRAYEGLGDLFSRQSFWALDAELKQEEAEKALSWYDKAISLNPAYMELQLSEARVYAALGENDEALARIEEAVQRSPNNALFHKELGLQLRAMHRYREALAAFGEAYRLQGHSDDMIRLNRKWLQERLKQEQKTPAGK